MHIAIIRLSSMGDIIIQTPWITWLKINYPTIKITFITLESFKGIIDNHPHIDDIIYLPRLSGKEDFKNLKKLAQQLNKNMDLIFDLHGTLRSNLIRLLAWRVPSLKPNKRTFLRWLLVKFKIDFLKKLESQHFRTSKDLSFILDSYFDEELITQFLKEKTKRHRVGLTSLSETFNKYTPKKRICLSPVASFASKRWPMEFVKNLIKEILSHVELKDFDIVLVAGPNDKYVNEALDEEILGQERFLNLQGKTNLQQTIKEIGQSVICVANDTGTGHIAEALGIPVVSLFGSTTESFGFAPHLSSSVALSAGKIACRPCSTTGKKPCFQKTHLCMEAIKIQMVMDSILKQVKQESINV